jgi:hypothetical protein
MPTKKWPAALNDLSIPSDDQIRTDYIHSGAPGHYRPDEVIPQIKNHRNWLNQQKSRQEKTLEDLLN